MKTRMSDSASVYLEDRYQHGDASGLARAMGMNFSPTDRWTLGANWGFGTLIDHQTHAETDRNAGGARLSYGFDELHLSMGVEYRDDETEQPDLSENDRETWLFRNNFRFQLTPSSRLLGKYNHMISDSSLGDFFDGGYREGVLGYAYRPVEFDRLHTLAKYTYFYNVPTTDQLTLQNVPAQFIQQSHVAGAGRDLRHQQVLLDRREVRLPAEPGEPRPRRPGLLRQQRAPLHRAAATTAS